MGTHIIKMPDIGEGIAEVELVGWHVKPGDEVIEDQTLADVMTDKANVEIPSPVKGRVLALGGEVGQTLAVGAELIRIEVEGAGNVRGEARPAAAPPPREPVREVQAPPPPPPVERPVPVAEDDRPIASPALRRRAWELGVDLKDVKPSGAGGRVLQADLDARVATPGFTRATWARSPGETRDRVSPRTDEEEIRVIGLRRKIAQKMQEAKRRIPHFSYVEEIDVTEIEALRARLNERFGAERARLTLLPFLIRATVAAVRDFPMVNARFDDEAGIITRHGAVHLGVATQTPSGLLVPVLMHAEARDLWSTAAEVARLAEVARAGRATRAELSGSTITITSLGALGGIATTPVINHPEVAIVGVNRIVERPVLRGGLVVARQMMNLSSSFDHRVVDGIDAARFIQAVRGYLESPATMFL